MPLLSGLLRRIHLPVPGDQTSEMNEFHENTSSAVPTGRDCSDAHPLEGILGLKTMAGPRPRKAEAQR